MTNDSLAETVSKLLRLAPDQWADIPFEESTDEEILAIRKLTEAGFIEQRVTVRIQIPGIDPAYRITFEATGEFGGEYALRAVKQDWWARWGKHLEVLAQELGKPVELIVIPERIQWRITDQGRLARADLEKGEQCPIDFALKRGFFDGRPRLLPDGRSTCRQPVPGHGHLVSIENVQDKPLAVDVAKFSAASELAQAFAKEFAPVIKAALAETRAAGTGHGSEGQPPPETGKPAGEFVFLREGCTWFIRAFGEQGHFKNLKGFECIAKLLACPDKVVPMEEFEGTGRGSTRPAKSDLPDELANADGLNVGLSPQPQPVLDEEAMRSIKEEIDELNDEIEEAQRCNDFLRAENARARMDELLEQYLKDTRPNGQSKTFRSDIDTWRAKIWNNIRYACGILEKGAMPKTADHFLASISAAGGGYVYRPSPPILWDVKGS